MSELYYLSSFIDENLKSYEDQLADLFSIAPLQRTECVPGCPHHSPHYHIHDVVYDAKALSEAEGQTIKTLHELRGNIRQMLPEVCVRLNPMNRHTAPASKADLDDLMDPKPLPHTGG